MPTVVMPVAEGIYNECADRLWPHTVGPTSRHGLRSRVPKPSDGASGAAIQGVMYHTFASNPMSGMGYPAGPAEGWYLKGYAVLFRDLGIPRGATIESAQLSTDGTVYLTWATDGGSGYPLGTPPVGYPRIYGVLEPDAQIRIVGDVSGCAYDSDSHVQHFAQMGYRRRWRMQSGPQHRQHTSAVVEYRLVRQDDLHENALPDVAPVIQEIVNQRGWKPNNRLVLQFDASADGACGMQITGGSLPITLTVTYT